MKSGGADAPPLLSIEGLTKTFPGVLAVDGVTLRIDGGQVLALLGQNGAGKSTLIQVLAGIHPHGSFAGSIAIEGQPFRPASVAEAERAGVAFLAQEVNIAPDLSVAQTLWLGEEPVRRGLIDRPLMRARAKAALKGFGLDLDADAAMGDLDLATQQLVLIVRALAKDARLLILDEPTAALNEREAARLFERMRALAARGVAVVFVSHRLAEVFAVSDRIVVLRDGRLAGDFPAAATSHAEVVACMVGRSPERARPAQGSPGPVAFGVRALKVRTAGAVGRSIVRGLDLEVRKGEVVGLFGLLGSGVVEACMAMFGAWRGPVAGEFRVDGGLARIASPTDAVRLRIGLIGQDRREGLSGQHSIHDNAILASLGEVSGRGGLIDRMAARRLAQSQFDRLGIRAPGIDAQVGTLSGGNQQKVQVARWLAAGVRSLILIDPTRGVDVGARAEITRIWAELAAQGRAILLASTDAEELIEICDRVVVMRAGRAVADLPRTDLSEDALLRLAAGI